VANGNNTDLEQIEIQLQKMQDSLRNVKQQEFINNYHVNVASKKNGQLLQKSTIRTSPSSNDDEGEVVVDQGIIVEVFNYLPEYALWVVKYKDNFGFLDATSLLIVKDIDSMETELSVYDTKPELKTYVKPEYPEDARIKKIEGKVILKIYVDKNGEVKDAIIYQGIDELNRTAKNTALRYKFKPALYNGKPVPAWIPLAISFKL
jgi:TonB family protein